ncbi:MAG TPA: NADH-quinone oxidoreductase subunit L [Actinomycetes bacterium]|nr:NADH-quinone oxidoreductase subunit L [Actinomycetes bacterium]
MTPLAWVIPAAPFVAAALGLLSGGRWPRGIGPIGMGGTAVATLAAILVAAGTPHGGPPVEHTTQLTPTGSIPIVLGTRVDGLASTVAIMVCLVALAVQVYSTKYMEGDRRYSSYTAFVSLFTAAMLLVVLSADLIVLLVGWEVMGICSYFLIGHYWERDWAQSAAVKAFVMTKLGDVPFLFGIFVLGAEAGSFKIGNVLAAVGDGRIEHVTIATLLLLGGVVGKSAQFPLQSWLPDAMAGPTPISALIHAATMVAAGMYFIARLYPAFAASQATLTVLALIASITMLGSALAALAQDDIKRVLAYSTMSQLAYMGAGLAVGAPEASMFLLLAHGAFKALLFLSAGAVIHAIGTNSLREMGGLRGSMPVTFATMTIGLAALAGLPPLSGFFSKEAILTATEHAATSGGAAGIVDTGSAQTVFTALPQGWAAWIVFLTALLTVGVTGAYCLRLWLMAFIRPDAVGPREGALHTTPSAAAAAGGAASPGASESGMVVAPAESVPHDAPPAMTWVLVALAIPSALLGFFGLASSGVSRWLGDTATAAVPGLVVLPETEARFTPGVATTVVSLAVVAVGLLVTYTVWRREPAGDPADALLGRSRAWVERGYGSDEVYDKALVQPTYAAARAVLFIDANVVDRTVIGSGAGARRLGGVLRLVQNGNVQTYLAGVLIGAVAIALSVAVIVG